jgi:hypothetical protein
MTFSATQKNVAERVILLFWRKEGDTTWIAVRQWPYIGQSTLSTPISRHKSSRLGMENLQSDYLAQKTSSSSGLCQIGTDSSPGSPNPRREHSTVMANIRVKSFNFRWHNTINLKGGEI